MDRQSHRQSHRQTEFYNIRFAPIDNNWLAKMQVALIKLQLNHYIVCIFTVVLLFIFNDWCFLFADFEKMKSYQVERLAYSLIVPWLRDQMIESVFLPGALNCQLLSTTEEQVGYNSEQMKMGVWELYASILCYLIYLQTEQA